MSDEVLFTQKLVSKDNDNKVTIEWMVENNTRGLIENALALSQCYTHDFGNFEDGEVKSIIFDVELPSDESLKMDLAKCSIRLDNLYKTADEIKSEAIKEFAERLKHFIIPQKADGYTREIVLKRDIDNLVKEMTEE